MSSTAVLLLSCTDQPGIVAAVAQFVSANGGNIVRAEQHTDVEINVFFQRVEFELDGFALAHDQIAAAFQPVAERFQMKVDLRFSESRPRLAVLASKEPHCLLDTLIRWRASELAAELVLVASNHREHAELCEFYGVDYFHLPVGDDRDAQDDAMSALLAENRIDLVVLARYMRVLSADFVERWPNKIINIHHSFLPAFVGAQPYRQAHERGVKIIGATAHYVTAELDQGPIIEQDVAHISHRDGVADLVRKGRDMEVVVLARALRAHLENRVLPYGHRTVVFS